MISQIKKTFYRWVNSEGSPNSLLLAMALGVASFGILLSFLAFQSPVFEPSPGKPMVAEIDVYSGPSSLTGTVTSSSSALNQPTTPPVVEQTAQSVAVAPSTPQAKTGVSQAPKTPSKAKQPSALAEKAKAEPKKAPPAKKVPPASVVKGPDQPALAVKPAVAVKPPVASKPALTLSPAKSIEAQAKPTQPVLAAKPQQNKATAPQTTTAQNQPVLSSKPAVVKTVQVRTPAPTVQAKAVAKQVKPVEVNKAKVSSQAKAPGSPKANPVPAPSNSVSTPRIKTPSVQVSSPNTALQVSTQAPVAKPSSTDITFSMPPTQQAGTPNVVAVQPVNEALEPVAVEPVAVEPITVIQESPSGVRPEQQCTRLRQVGQVGEMQAVVLENVTRGNDDCMFP